RAALWRKPPWRRARMVKSSASDMVPLSYAIYSTIYYTCVSPDRPSRADCEVPPPGRRAGGDRTGSLLERERAVAGDAVDLGTPGGRGLWLDRSPTRNLSDADDRTRAPALRAPRDGDLLAWHARPPSFPSLPNPTAEDVAMHQAWGVLSEETKHAFGTQFSHIIMRVLRGLQASKVTV